MESSEFQVFSGESPVGTFPKVDDYSPIPQPPTQVNSASKLKMVISPARDMASMSNLEGLERQI